MKKTKLIRQLFKTLFWSVVFIHYGATAWAQCNINATECLDCPQTQPSLGNIGYTTAVLTFNVQGKPNTSQAFGIAISENGGAFTNAGGLGTFYCVGGAATFTLTNLKPGTSYRYQISQSCNLFHQSYEILNRCGTSQTNYTFPVSAPFTTLTCKAPSGLQRTAATNTSITVAWTGGAGAVTYKLRYRQTGTSNWINTINNIAGTSYTIGGLAANTGYEYQVASACTSGSFAYDNWSALAATTTATTAPKYLVVYDYNRGYTKVIANWEAVTGAVSYEIEVKPVASTTWATTVATGATTTAATISNLSPTTEYNIRIRAKKANGTYSPYGYGWWNPNFRTLRATLPYNFTVPAIYCSGSAGVSWVHQENEMTAYVRSKPTNSTVWGAASKATLSWIAAPYTENASLYSLANGGSYDWQVQGVWQALANFTKTDDSQVPVTPIPGDVYTSDFASGPSFTVPPPCCPAPLNPSVSNITLSSALLSWTPMSYAINYVVEYKANSAATWIPVQVFSNSLTLSGLSSNTIYNWRVKTNCSGAGSASSGVVTGNNFLTASAPTCIASNLYATGNWTRNIDPGSRINIVTLSWAGSATVTQYEVKYVCGAADVFYTTGTSYTLPKKGAGRYVVSVRPTACSGGDLLGPAIYIAFTVNVGTATPNLAFTNGPSNATTYDCGTGTVARGSNPSTRGASAKASSPLLSNIAINAANNGLTIFPNPANDRLTVVYRGAEKNGKANITIWNMLGKMVYQKETLTNKATLTEQIDTKQLPNGTYLVKVQVSNAVNTEKLVIKR